MMRSKILILIFLALFGLPSPVLAQDSPEAVYQAWVEASRAGDIDRLLTISSAAKVKEYHNEVNTPEKREEMKKIMKMMAPITYQVKKTEVSKEGRKAVLLVDATARDFFSLDDPKVKPQHENVEVRLVKEENQWKVDQHCMGSGGCGDKEERAEQASFGKKIPLKDGVSLTVQKGSGGPFASVKAGNPFVVDLTFQGSQTNPMLNYALNPSPTFADFYVKVGDQKISPVAIIENPSTKDVTVLQANTTYSRSKTLNEKTVLLILFDVPRDLKGPKTFWASFTVAEQNYTFEMKD
jgi:SnoaL-like protein